ncbi:hypothetical protein [Bradyrhizobium sp. NAS96.2]|uniref:hypothetical protein n=1 Tax=Bradyrhizobium sp. NAS96.2 TaxID=1680160 RepID=UPI0011615494|nr:hypothetical protein [Bradyrhizobium sp. NAS96.2]
MVVENHRPIGSDIRYPIELAKRHVEPASGVAADVRRRHILGDRPMSREQHRQAPALSAPAAEASVEAASDDLATGLPRPKPWLLTTARNSPLIEAVRVETALGLAAVLSFYRGALGKRGWTENGVPVVEPDRAMVAFTTSSGPALLRLIRQHDRTVAGLLVRKSAAANAELQPAQGQVRLLFGNTTDETAVITINEQTIKLDARAGRHLTDAPATGRRSPDGAEINLPPGMYKVALQIAGGAAQTLEFAVAADETWGLLVGPDGVALPMRLY